MKLKLSILAAALLGPVLLTGCDYEGGTCVGEWRTVCDAYGCHREYDPCGGVYYPPHRPPHGPIIRPRPPRGPIVHPPRPRRPIPPGRRPGRPPRHRWATPAVELTPVQEFALHLEIPVPAAERINAAYEAAMAGDMSLVRDLGLDTGDLIRLQTLGTLSMESAARVGAQLGLEAAKVKDVAETMAEEIKAAYQDRESAHWQKCIDAGEWSTPQNASCSQEFWSGCSPATGASMCFVK